LEGRHSIDQATDSGTQVELSGSLSVRIDADAAADEKIYDDLLAGVIK